MYDAAMFGPSWRASPRRFDYVRDSSVRIKMPDGVELDASIWRPDVDEPCPAILGFHAYHPDAQTGPIEPGALSTGQWRNPGQERTNASLEAGDPVFFARRGYAHVVCNARGTGRSGGEWDFVGNQEVRDCASVIDWIAAAPWCNGDVGMFGASYFARIQLLVAALKPKPLKALFCPWGSTDYYRDIAYRGGIFAYRWPLGWSQTSLKYANCRPRNHSKAALGQDAYTDAVSRLLDDPDIAATEELAAIVRSPESGVNSWLVDLMLHPCYDQYWEERTARYDQIDVPAFIGGDWSAYGNHLPAAFRSWSALSGPKKMIIGPPYYLDRPVYQLQHEAVRWFDHWLKGVPTGVMEEPPVRVFVMNTNQWKSSDDWPLPETKFTPFFLHEDGLLSEREYWPFEASASFEDSPWGRGALTYWTPRLVEDTEVVGPMVLKLHAATTDNDVNWVVSLLERDPEGRERLLTKGWLKGSHRALDLERSTPWSPVHSHRSPEPLRPLEINEFVIALVPTGNLFKAGASIGLKISGADDPPTNALELIGSGSLPRSAVARVTVFHDEQHPSYLLLPITGGNVLGTYMSGGRYGP